MNGSPEATIIIVTYNGLQETTAPCLESILREPTSVNFEVVVVDNASSDGTPDYLMQAAERSPRIRPLLNKTNRGFAGGNNDGIRTARGEYLVLLNSDTRVTEGWLETLLAPLRRDNTIGLIGPVSNEVGNEQRIHIKSAALPEEIIAEGMIWSRMSVGDTFETDRLGFFCIAMTKKLVDEVGLLDEGFSLGFYEDDDYCIRVRQAGYRLICAEDVFIYHKGSASFSRLSRERQALLKKNKKLLEAKQGIKYRPAHPRDRQMDLVEAYLARASAEELTRSLDYKIKNRLALAETLRPRGIIKKMRFIRRMNSLRSMLPAYSQDER